MSNPVSPPRVEVSPEAITGAMSRSSTGQINGADPCTVVIFGAGGDLAKRKLYPAIYELANQRLLSDDFALLGLVRDAVSDDEFRKELREAITSSDEIHGFDEKVFAWLAPRCFTAVGDLDDPKTYDTIKAELSDISATL